jgi:hypothetical protein
VSFVVNNDDCIVGFILTGVCRKAYISFGGLLMSLEGPYKKLTPLRVDYTYLLVKK